MILKHVNCFQLSLLRRSRQRVSFGHFRKKVFQNENKISCSSPQFARGLHPTLILSFILLPLSIPAGSGGLPAISSSLQFASGRIASALAVEGLLPLVERAILQGVGLVAGRATQRAGVIPQDRAGHPPVFSLQRMRGVDILGLSIVLTELTYLGATLRTAAAAGPAPIGPLCRSSRGVFE